MSAVAQQQHPDEPMVGTTANLGFYSDFWLNLHHVLYAAAWDRRPEKGLARAAGESVGFETSLSPDEQRIWDGAVAVYLRDVASKDLLFDSHMTALKFALGTAGDDLPSSASWFPAEVRNALMAAAPVYRAHAWAADDRANRAWIADARRHLDALAPDVTPRLASLLGTPWPTTPIRMDAVRVGTRQGAYTTIDPKWIVVSTSDPHNQGWAAAEILFHETSHLLIGPIDQALDAASRDLHVAVPRSLWHVVLFYTAGALTKQALAHRGVTYEPYLYKTGLFDRAWPMYRPAIESVLPDFVAGKRTREDMAHALVGMLAGGQGQALQGDHSVPQPAPSEGKPKALGESHGRPVLIAYLAQSR